MLVDEDVMVMLLHTSKHKGNNHAEQVNPCTGKLLVTYISCFFFIFCLIFNLLNTDCGN